MEAHGTRPRARSAPARAALHAAGVLARGHAAGCGGDEEPSPAGSTDTETPDEAATTAEPPPGGAGPANGSGGDGGAADPGPEPLTAAQLTDIVGRFFTSADPALACRELVTARLIRSAYGDRAGCEAAQVPAAAAGRVRFDDIEISRTRAVATVTPKGGASDGVELTAELVPAGGEWRIDSLDADVPVGP